VEKGPRGQDPETRKGNNRTYPGVPSVLQSILLGTGSDSGKKRDIGHLAGGKSLKFRQKGEDGGDFKRYPSQAKRRKKKGPKTRERGGGRVQREKTNGERRKRKSMKTFLSDLISGGKGKGTQNS